MNEEEIMERKARIQAFEELRQESGYYLYAPSNQPERSKREDLKKCVVCECERPNKEIPNGVCDDCSEDSTYADSF